MNSRTAFVTQWRKDRKESQQPNSRVTQWRNERKERKESQQPNSRGHAMAQ
jgi:hypothetical protein